MAKEFKIVCGTPFFVEGKINERIKEDRNNSIEVVGMTPLFIEEAAVCVIYKKVPLGKGLIRMG